jgi:hypothetical protein
MCGHGADAEGMVDQGVTKAYSPVKHVDNRDGAFRPLEGIAKSTGGIEIDGDDFETTCGSGRTQRIAARRLSDTTF